MSKVGCFCNGQSTDHTAQFLAPNKKRMLDWKSLVENKQATSLHLIKKKKVILSCSAPETECFELFDIGPYVERDLFFELFQSNCEPHPTSLSFQSKLTNVNTLFVVVARPTLKSIVAVTKCRKFSLLIYHLHPGMCLCVFIMRPMQIKKTLNLVESLCGNV